MKLLMPYRNGLKRATGGFLVLYLMCSPLCAQLTDGTESRPCYALTIRSAMANKQTATPTTPITSAPINVLDGPYKTNSAIRNAFRLAQRGCTIGDLAKLASASNCSESHIFGNTGVFATARRSESRHGKNGWTSAVLLDGKRVFNFSANGLKPETKIQIVDVAPASATDLVRIFQHSDGGIIRGSQSVETPADMDRNPVTGKIMVDSKPETTTESAKPSESPKPAPKPAPSATVKPAPKPAKKSAK